MRLAIAFLLLAFRLQAATTTIAASWDAVPGATNYVFHWGTNSGSYFASTNFGSGTNFTLTLTLSPGTNVFALTAVNTSGLESPFSDELSITMPSLAPKNFKVKLSMDSAPSPSGPWTETLSLTNSVAVTDAAYFRGRLDIKPSDGLP